MTDPTYETPVRLVSAWASWQTVLIDLRAARADWQKRTDRARDRIASKVPPELHGTAANLLEEARRAGYALLLDDVAARSTTLSVQRDEILAWLAVQQECCELVQNGRRFSRVDDLRFGTNGALDNESILRFAAPLLESASFDEWFEGMLALRFRLDPEPEGHGDGDEIIAFLWRVLRVVAEESGRPCPDEPCLEEVPPIADVRRALDTARNWLLTTPDAPATIVALRQQQYRIREGSVVLTTDEQDDVLQAFLDNPPKWKGAERLTTAEIENRCAETRTGRIHSILKALKKGPLGAAIDLPGKGRKGQGYGVLIRHDSTGI